MSDRELAEALAWATATERSARAHWQGAAEATERDAALAVVRHVTAVQKVLESWIAARAVRATLARS